MIEKHQIALIYIISAIFIAANLFLVVNEFYWLSLLPLFLLVLVLFFFSLDKLILLIVFSTPLSINLKDLELGASVSIPTEPLMFGVMILFFIKLFSEQKFDKRILNHPVSIAVFFYLIWLFITSCTSEMPIISFKFLVSRLWFIITFYFLATQLFKEYKNIKLFIWMYVIPLTGIIFYTIYNHSLYGFSEESAHYVMTPFFNDHTEYGAILALFIPFTIGFVFYKNYSKTIKILSFIFFAVFIFATILSFSRASWISLGATLLTFIIIKLKINFSYILIVFVAMTSLFFIFNAMIFSKLETNKQASSENLTEHIQSISNISTDASNLERINRWQSAFRMFNERPIMGWGPGTYQFVYAPFQKATEKTFISTNAGEKGNAHSEYIGPLAEAGILGLLTFLGIVITFIHTSLRLYKKTENKKIRLLTLLVLLGMVTYFIHGFLNNFLQSDKASVPFWGFVALIVAMDVYHKNKTAEDTVLPLIV